MPAGRINSERERRFKFFDLTVDPGIAKTAENNHNGLDLAARGVGRPYG
jgi:hypothetical protein